MFLTTTILYTKLKVG